MAVTTTVRLGTRCDTGPGEAVLVAVGATVPVGIRVGCALRDGAGVSVTVGSGVSDGRELGVSLTVEVIVNVAVAVCAGAMSEASTVAACSSACLPISSAGNGGAPGMSSQPVARSRATNVSNIRHPRSILNSIPLSFLYLRQFKTE